MANINFSNLTAPNGAIRDLRQLIMQKLSTDPAFTSYATIMSGVYDGDKLAVLSGFGYLGKAASSCNPTYGNSLIGTTEKEWDVATWEIAEKICAATLQGTFEQIALKSHTSMDDLTGTDYIDEVLMPFLQKAIYATLFRIIWFADKSASVYDSVTNPTGTLKAGQTAGYFTMTDGLWDQIFTGVSGGTISRDTITANTQTTTALQTAGIRTAGVASAILDNLIDNAPSALRETDTENQVILVSQGLYDAAMRDVKNGNEGSETQFDSWFAGLKASKWDGITIIAMPMWDSIVKNSLMNTTNTSAWELPFRAVYTTKDNLIIGTHSTDLVEEIDYWFSKDDRDNKIYVKDTVGALIANDNLIHVAY